jgi:hypothetical protein
MSRKSRVRAAPCCAGQLPVIPEPCVTRRPKVPFVVPAPRRDRGTHLVYPPAVCSQSRVLTPGDDRSAPRTDLPGSTRLVILWIEVCKLPILAVVLLYLALRRVFAILRQHALGLLPETLGLLPRALFLAVLGRQRGPRYVRDRRAFPGLPVTLPRATVRAIPYGPGRVSPVLVGIRYRLAVRDPRCSARPAYSGHDAAPSDSGTPRGRPHRRPCRCWG